MADSEPSEHLDLIRHYGGPVTASDCHEALWETYVDVVPSGGQAMARFIDARLAPRWAGRPISVAAVNSSDVNACAVPGKQGDHIFVYRGLLERVFGYSLALFATREILPAIGDAKIERPLKDTAPYFSQHANLKTAQAPISPRCSTRGWCSVIFSALAMHVVLSHEFGHIVGGHFELMRKRTAGPVGIDECSAQEGRLDISVPLACVERDADNFASNMCWYTQDSIQVVEGARDWLAKTVTDLQSISPVMFGLAAHILFRCLCVRPVKSYTLSPNSYPPPSLRGVNLLIDMLKRASFVRGPNHERDLEVFKVIVQVEETVKHLENASTGDDWFARSTGWGPEMGRLFQKYRDKFEAVRRTQETWRPIWKDD